SARALAEDRLVDAVAVRLELLHHRRDDARGVERALAALGAARIEGELEDVARLDLVRLRVPLDELADAQHAVTTALEARDLDGDVERRREPAARARRVEAGVR